MLKGSCPPDFDDEAMLSSSDLEKIISLLAAPWLESTYLRPKLAALQQLTVGAPKLPCQNSCMGVVFKVTP